MKTEIIQIDPISLPMPQILPESENLLTNARKIVITTQTQYLESDTVLKVVKSKLSKLKAELKYKIDPLTLAKERVSEPYKKPIEFLKEAEKIIKDAQVAYVQAQEQARKGAEAKLQAQADKARREAEEKATALRQQAEIAYNAGKDKEAGKLLAKAVIAESKAETIVAPVLPGVELAAGSSLRTNWYAEVVDFKVLPDEYKLPDQKKLDALARASKGVLTLPGVIFKQEQTIASRIEALDAGF